GQAARFDAGRVEGRRPPAPRSGAHPGRRRIQRAARVAPGAARRDEGEGARALPRRGPPLLRGAGAMRLTLVALLALVSSTAQAAAPSEIVAATKKVDALLDAWHFGAAASALAAH